MGISVAEYVWIKGECYHSNSDSGDEDVKEKFTKSSVNFRQATKNGDEDDPVLGALPSVSKMVVSLSNKQNTVPCNLYRAIDYIGL